MESKIEAKTKTQPQKKFLARVGTLFRASPKEQTADLPAEHFLEFEKAVSEGNLEKADGLMKSAEKLNGAQTLLTAKDSAVFQLAAQLGNRKIVKHMMVLAERVGCLEGMLAAGGYKAFLNAVENKHTKVVVQQLALTQSMPELQNAMVEQLSPALLARLVRGGDYQVLEPLLPFLSVISKIDKTITIPESFEQKCFGPFVERKLQALHELAKKNKQGFDLHDEQEAMLCFHMLKYLIIQNKPNLNSELKFLLDIPAVRALAHTSTSTMQYTKVNQLLKLAQWKKNTEAMAVLRAIPLVSKLEAEELEAKRRMDEEDKSVEVMVAATVDAMHHDDERLPKSKIPNKIHLLWVGATLPKEQADNLVAWLKHTPEDWKIHLWLSHPKQLSKARYFSDLERYPEKLVIENVHDLLNDNELFEELNHRHLDCNNIDEVRTLLARELIGIGNPAAAKDGFAPLILYKGGYFFDFDACPIRALSAVPHAPRGFLVLNKGQMVGGFAAEPGHIFCVYALQHFVDNYLKMHQKTYPAKASIEENAPVQLPSFFELEPLRQRILPETQAKLTVDERRRLAGVARTKLTIETSGTILNNAYDSYVKALFKFEQSTLRFENFDKVIKEEVQLPVEKAPLLQMGVKMHLEQVGLWRTPKKVAYAFDDIDPEFQRLSSPK